MHSDVFRPIKNPSIDGMHYMLIFIDYFSRNAKAYFVKEKTEVFTKFKKFQERMKREFGRNVENLCTNNGKEYISMSSLNIYDSIKCITNWRVQTLHNKMK